MQQIEIKELLENSNFRNNQNYVISDKSIDKFIKFVISYKFEKKEDGYFGELLVEKFKKNRIQKIKIDLLKLLVFGFFSIYFYLLVFPVLFYSLYILYLISYYFAINSNFQHFIIVKDNKKILFSQMWYYKSKIKLGITKVYYKHY